MHFIIYLHKESFIPRNAAIREAALNAVVHAVNGQRKTINEEFGIRNWEVVI
jgi:hypothetical protein